MRVDDKNFSAEDLAADSRFIEWVKHPNPENTTSWETWLAQHAEKAEEVALARQLVNGWSVKLPTPPEGSFSHVWEKIQADRAVWEAQASDNQKRYFLNWRNYRSWAAALLGLLLVGAAFYWTFNEWNTTRYATRPGETKTIRLPDGSTVILNSNSALSFAKDWKAAEPREVRLTGEAFFSVTHQADHRKFVVKIPDQLWVEVLGTTFTVSERATTTQVVLNSGKVSLYPANGKAPLLMKPGELVQVSKNRQTEVFRRRVNPEVYSAWKDNQFIFDNTSLGEIAAMIESNFNYQVQFADSALKNKRMTIRMPERDLDLLLVALAEAHDLKISRKDNRILIEDVSFAK